MTTSSSFPRMVVTLPAIHLSKHITSATYGIAVVVCRFLDSTKTHFFMTWMLTFCMSTFRLNSGGNLVLFSSLASTPVAMLAGLVPVRRLERPMGLCCVRVAIIGEAAKLLIVKMMSLGARSLMWVLAECGCGRVRRPSAGGPRSGRQGCKWTGHRTVTTASMSGVCTLTFSQNDLKIPILPFSSLAVMDTCSWAL